MSRKATTPTVPIEVIDCETDPFLYGREPRPFLWGWTDGSIYRDFSTTEALVAFISKRKAIIYAHNGGKFDFHFLLQHLTPETEILIINGRVAKATLGQAELRDSYCILPVGLAQYNKTVIDYAKMEEKVRHKHMAEIQAYLRDDCHFLYELVRSFTDNYGRAITLASAAMKYWKGMGHDIPESDKAYYESMCRWYAGGRVECFSLGEIRRPFQVVDINSAYPFAMMEQHPYSVTYDTVDNPTMDPHRIKGASLYRVKAWSDGALPWRGEKGALEFPHDAEAPREYCCTGWELRAGLRTKTVKIAEAFERLDFHVLQDFRGYVNHFFQLKASSAKGSPERLISKLFLNSLYGKFCADPSDYKNYAVVDPCSVPDWTGGKKRNEGIGKLRAPWASAGALGDMALLTNSGLEFNEDGEDMQNRSSYYNVATGASITGFVRAYLWESICKIKKKGGMPIYCDTDSIAFIWEKKEKPPVGMSDALGDWTNEGRFDYAAIAGKKLYAFRHQAKKGEKPEWKLASKGVRLDADDIVKVAKGASVTYRHDAPSMRVGTKGSTVTFIERTVKRTGKKTA